jgi:hypothetical protein
MYKPVFAVDVGGVLASQQHDGEPVTDSLAALQLMEPHFDLWIVSMCGVARAQHTKRWLRDNGFGDLFPHDKQIYIGFNHDSKNAALADLNATFFVDDRVKHVRPALGLPLMYCVFHMSPIPHEDMRTHHRYAHVYGWADILDLTPWVK